MDRRHDGTPTSHALRLGAALASSLIAASACGGAFESGGDAGADGASSSTSSTTSSTSTTSTTTTGTTTTTTTSTTLTSSGGAGGGSTCQPGQYRCTGAMLEQCDLQGQNYVGVTPCDSPELCDDAHGRCDHCVPNATTCAPGDILQTCAEDGQSLLGAVCEAPLPRCVALQDGARCAQCQPGEATCAGSVLMKCSPAGTPAPETCPPGFTCKQPGGQTANCVKCAAKGELDAEKEVGKVAALLWGLALADLDGDGKLDIAAASPSNNAVYVLRNQGGGTFDPPVPVMVAANPNQVVAADFDGDGKVDLAAGDLTADGKPDLVVTPTSPNVIVLPNLGGNKFAPGVPSASTGPGYGVALGDVDKDGKLDVVMIDGGQARVTWLRGTGAAPLGSATPANCNASPYGLAVVDLDGDGYPEIVTTSAQNARIQLLHNAKGVLTGTPFDVAGANHGVAAGDVDGDGRPDVVVACGAGNTSKLTVLRNDGNGGLGARADYDTNQPSRAVAIGDVTGDGLPDVVFTSAVVSPPNGSISVLAGKCQ
jgi:hypothetical protein